MATVLRLTILTGPHRGERYCIRDVESVTVGRSSACPVRLVGAIRDRAVSRLHCRLEVQPDGVRIVDLESSNGTYVNGSPVPPCSRDCSGRLLDEGDILTLGSTSLRFDRVECPPPGTEASWRPGETVKKNCPNAVC